MLDGLPLSFAPNRGQTDSRVKFISAGLSIPISFTSHGVSLGGGTVEPTSLNDPLSLSFVGANREPRVEGQARLPGKRNHFIGSDPSKWLTDVPTFAVVVYHDLYPGIDVRFHGTGSQLEYDFDLAPGADPRRIRIKFGPEASLQRESNGDLVIETGGVSIRQHLPRAYQTVAGVPKSVQVHPVLHQGNEVSFTLGYYDRKRLLVIDPAVDYVAHVAGTRASADTVAVDAAGEVFVAGSVTSAFSPTSGAFQTSFGGRVDGFVMKLDNTGTVVLYATFLGGSDFDGVSAIAIDTAGDAYVMGGTTSSNFPTTAGAFQRSLVGPFAHIFVSVLNPTGAALKYSTYLSGTYQDES